MANRFQKYLQILSKIRFSNIGLYYGKLVRNFSKGLKPLWFKLLNKKFDPENAIIIFSENRGGSTWLMETLQSQLNAITSFEPLFGWEGNFKKHNHRFSSPFYFGDDDSKPVLRKFLWRTFEGKEISNHTLQFNSLSQLYCGDRLLVKLVNVNLIAPWVASVFDLKYRPVYLIRHPLAILSSQIKYNAINGNSLSDQKVDDFDLDRIKCDSHPYLPYMYIINSADTRFKRFLVGWCIRNKDFLSGSHTGDVITVYYEDLVLNESEVLKNVYREWGIPEPEEKSIESSKASGTTAIGERVLDGRRQLRKWVDFFSSEEKNDFQKIFDRFGIKEYNAFEALPRHLQSVTIRN